MSDQAEVLRQAAQRGRNREPLRRLSQRKSDDTARVVAVTSGKGGVGKTSFVVNLAVVLADLGMRVTILDADLGLANVDVLLGLAARHNLHHVINGTLSLEDILIKGPRDVQIIPGASGLRDIADMGLEDRKYLVESLYKTTRGRDLVIVDTAAGMSRNVLDFVLSAQEIIVLTAPEPAAMTDAYAMIKVISRENPNSVVRLVVNMCPNRTEAENVVEQLTLLSDRFLDFSFDALGYIPTDPLVGKAIRARQPFVLAYPYVPASAAMVSIARRLRGMPEQDHSEAGVGQFIKRLLGVAAPDYLL
ncbi:MAG: MinD/ParA family protein [Firmicutes bacterium]|nr:MinD/ParA family protein [Bacillota bacterium]